MIQDNDRLHRFIIENSQIYGVADDLLDQIFDFMIRDFSKYALQLYAKTGSTPQQMALCLKMIRKPAVHLERFEKIWREYAYALKDTYTMNG